MAFPDARKIRDLSLVANIAMPNANATTYSTFIDLGAVTPFPATEKIALAAVIPAVANLANTKTITISVEDADANANANAAALSLAGSFDITGGASGSDAVTKYISLPGVTRRFVRLKAVGGSAAGTTITESGTAEIRT
jgi:hypothetical protein